MLEKHQKKQLACQVDILNRQVRQDRQEKEESTRKTLASVPLSARFAPNMPVRRPETLPHDYGLSTGFSCFFLFFHSLALLASLAVFFDFAIVLRFLFFTLPKSSLNFSCAIFPRALTIPKDHSYRCPTGFATYC